MFEQDNLLQIILEVEYRYNNTLCMFCKVRSACTRLGSKSLNLYYSVQIFL